MMRTIFFLALFFLPCLFCIAQDGDSIVYNPSYKLTWDDFLGKPKSSGPDDALTNTSYKSSFRFSQKGKETKVEFNVVCAFIKSGSWVRQDKKIDYLLNHEQRHFDIAECGARELRKKVGEVHFTKSNYSALIRKITTETENKYARLEQQYDTETNHSRDESKQQKWNEKIDGLLAELDGYKLAE